MRVITGSAKGHKLFSLEGSDTRPTTDRVKEGMFSSIQQYIDGSAVLDLFAGSGALGIEALSRGAKLCDFVEQSKAAAKIVEANLVKTKLEGGKIYITDAQQFLQSCGKKYDIVLLDPPYKKGLCDLSINLLSDNNLLNLGAIIVCETYADEEITSPFEKIKEHKYGTVKVTVFEIR